MTATHAPARLALSCTALLLALACGPHRPHPPAPGSPASGAEGPATASPESAGTPAPYRAPLRMAFSADAQVLVVGEVPSRKMKLRFYGQAPDRFRIEARGPVGGVALVMTGRDGRIRIVIPSKRRYAEGAMADDLAAGLVGVSLSGCDLAMVVRISSGFKKFHPCGGVDPNEDTPVSAIDRPGLIVDTSVSGEEILHFGWDWGGEGAFPKEMRVESLEPPETSLALTDFKSLEVPAAAGDDFYWEPLPERAELVPLSELGVETNR